MDPYSVLQQKAQADGVDSTVVSLLIRRGRNLLLLKRRPDDFLPDVWETPGGHVDPGETIPQALARELLEETGLVLTEIVAHVGGYDYPGEFGTTRQWNFEVLADGSAITHPEHVEFTWAAPEEWDALHMSPDMRESLEQYARQADLYR